MLNAAAKEGKCKDHIDNLKRSSSSKGTPRGASPGGAQCNLHPSNYQNYLFSGEGSRVTLSQIACYLILILTFPLIKLTHTPILRTPSRRSPRCPDVIVICQCCWYCYAKAQCHQQREGHAPTHVRSEMTYYLTKSFLSTTIKY